MTTNNRSFLQESSDSSFLVVSGEPDNRTLCLYGDWVSASAGRLEAVVNNTLVSIGDDNCILDFSNLGQLDVTGAVMLHRLFRTHLDTYHGHIQNTTIRNAEKRHHILLDMVNKKKTYKDDGTPRPDLFMSVINMIVYKAGCIREDIWDTLVIVSRTLYHLLNWIRSPYKIRGWATAIQLQRIAIEAIPIIGLASFLLGLIITQQGGRYLRAFGAEIYVIDMASVLIIRELSIILTAVMIAGRTGSAITSEIGSMKMRGEVDAIKTMDLDPIEVLVLPCLLALVVSLPFLAVVSYICALTGAMTICTLYLDIPIELFLNYFSDAINISDIKAGLIKTPVMALLIAIISVAEGFKVTGSTNSLGKHTTLSVVKSIFLIIVIDGIFAVFITTLKYSLP